MYLPFQNASKPFLTVPPHVMSKLLRNNSCLLYVFPTQFIVFPNYSFSSQFYAIPMLLSAFRIVSSPAHYFTLHLHSITVHFVAAPFHYLTLLHFTIPYRVYAEPYRGYSLPTHFHSPHFLRLTTQSHRHSRHFSSIPLPIIAKLFCRLYTKQVVQVCLAVVKFRIHWRCVVLIEVIYISAVEECATVLWFSPLVLL